MVGTVISSKDVAPFPIILLMITSLVHTFKVFLVYFTNERLVRNHPQFPYTIYFPAAYTTLEFLSSIYSGGAWWSVANSQFAYPWFIQLASVTGIWGISFMIFWFGSVVVWAIQRKASSFDYISGLVIYAVAAIAILTYGGIRYNGRDESFSGKIRIAGITAPSFGFLTGLYKDFCGNEIILDPRSSISSPSLQEINKAEIPFIETADTLRFSRGYAAMKAINDSLFSMSAKVASQGAKIILWSEANALTFAFNENELSTRASQFAAHYKVYLLMTRAVIHPGKITMATKFLENEALLFGPDGTLLNIFHKNNPVPFAEASTPGDGIIPVIETPYGRLATSICYDADFPVQMRQLGNKQADLLLLPSGDWYAISPYHSYMAVFRGIENGTSIFRQVSGGLSLATDYRGRISGSMDFYQPGEKLWSIDFHFGHINTIYNRIGDLFAWICLGLTGLGLILIIGNYIVYAQPKKKLIPREA
jgi:apolipoprotein N-acyltransferase